MVSTTTLRPRSAARSASAAEVVVLPTPPEPQHTMISVPRSSRSASMSRTGVRFMPSPGCGAAGRARAGRRGRCRRPAGAARRSAGPRPRRARAARPRAGGVRRGRGPRRRARPTRAASTSTLARLRSEVIAVGSTSSSRTQRERGGAQVLGAHEVDHHAAHREAGGAQLGDRRREVSCTGISSRIVTRWTAVRGERSSVHHVVGLGLDRPDLGQPGELGVDPEELADPARRRRVEHHGVVRDGWPLRSLSPPRGRCTAS